MWRSACLYLTGAFVASYLCFDFVEGKSVSLLTLATQPLARREFQPTRSPVCLFHPYNARDKERVLCHRCSRWLLLRYSKVDVMPCFGDHPFEVGRRHVEPCRMPFPSNGLPLLGQAPAIYFWAKARDATLAFVVVNPL